MSETKLPVEWTAAQPYEQWREARESGCPVVETPAGTLGQVPGYMVTDWQHVETVLRDPETFSSNMSAVDLKNIRPLIPLQIDPPDHKKYRKILDPIFAPKQMDAIEDDVTERVNHFIDRPLCFKSAPKQRRRQLFQEESVSPRTSA